MEIKFKKISKDIQIYPEAFKRKVIEEFFQAAAPKWSCCVSMELKQKAAYNDG